jgi:hypothetical protein
MSTLPKPHDSMWSVVDVDEDDDCCCRLTNVDDDVL